jgi:hypothetical protein
MTDFSDVISARPTDATTAKMNLLAGQDSPPMARDQLPSPYPPAVQDLDPPAFQTKAEQDAQHAVVDSNPAVASFVAADPMHGRMDSTGLETLKDIATAHDALGSAAMAYATDSIAGWQRNLAYTFGQTQLDRQAAIGEVTGKQDRGAWDQRDPETGMSFPMKQITGLMGQLLSQSPYVAVGAGVGMLAGPAGVVAGANLGLIGGMTVDAIGSNYRKFDAYRDNNGEPLPESTKILMSLGGGAITAAALKLGMGELVPKTAMAAYDAIAGEVLKSPTAVSTISKVGEHVFSSGLTMGTMNAAMSAGDEFAGEIGKMASGQPFQTIVNDPNRLKEITGNVLDAFESGSLLGGAFGVIPSIGPVLDHIRSAQTQIDVASLAKQVDAASKAPLPPDRLADFVENHVKMPPVRVNAEALGKAMPAGLASDTGIRDAVQRETPSGGDVLIPAGQYLTKTTPQEHGVLAPDIRGQSGITQNESMVPTAAQPYVAKPNQLQLAEKPLPDEYSAFPDTKAFDIQGPAGKLGETVLTKDGKHVEVNWVGAGSESQVGTNYDEFKNTIGISGMRSLLQQVKLIYPDAETLGGTRISGARPEDASSQVKMNLPEAQPGPGALGARRSGTPMELATDIETASDMARSRLWLGGMFVDKPDKMSKADYVAYSKRLQQDQFETTQQVMKAAEGEYRKVDKGRMRDERNTATDTVNRRPDVVAMDHIRAGLKLDRTDTLASHPDFPDKLLTKDGIPPDVMAQQVGLDHGRDLLDRLSNVDIKDYDGWKKDQVETEATRTYGQKYGTGPEVVLQHALDAALSARQLDVLIDDWKHIGGGDALTREQIMDQVHEDMLSKRFDEARDVKGFQDAIQRHGQAAESNLLAGKTAEAFKEKQKQIMNFGYLKEAKKFDNLYRKTMKTVDQFSKKGKVDGVDQKYTDRIHQLLNQHDVPIPRSKQNLADEVGNKRLADFATDQYRYGNDIELNKTTSDPLVPISLNKMTMQQFSDFSQTLQSLNSIGRETGKILTRFKTEELTAVLADLEQKGLEMVPLHLAGKDTKLASWRREINAQMLKPEQMFDWIDPSIRSVMNDYVIRPLKEGQYKAEDLKKAVAADIRKLKDPTGIHDSVENYIFRDANGESIPMTRENLISVMLNLSNESNKRVLLKGYNTTEDAVINWVSQNIREGDLEYAQGVLDSLKKLEQPLLDATKAAKGIAVERVLPAKTTFGNHGTLDGGYWPLIADRTLDRVEGDLKTPFDRMVTSPFVDANSFHNRIGTTYPIDLSMDRAWSRVNETIHAIAMHEPVKQAWKIIDSSVFKKIMNDKFGPEYANKMTGWIKNIANNGELRDLSDDAKMLGLARAMRARTIGYLTGFNPLTMAIHGLSAMANSIGEEPRGIAKASFDILTSKKWRDFVNEKSGELRNRSRSMERDFGAAMDDSLGKSNLDRTILQAQMSWVAMSDKISADAVFLASFRRNSKTLDEDDAVALAEKAVRNAHGTGSIMDQTAFQRGPEWKKWLSVFMGFYTHIYNRQQNIGRQLHVDHSYSNIAIQSAKIMALIVAPAAIHAYFRPSGKKDESYTEWAARGIVEQEASTLPLARELLGGFDPQLSPVATLMKEGATNFNDLWKAANDKNKDPRLTANTLGLIGLVGPALGGLGVPGAKYGGWITKTTTNWAQDSADMILGTRRPYDWDGFRLLAGQNPKPLKKK